MNKIHVVEFTSGTTAKTITGLFQWNFGQILQIKGLDLPSAVEVHFALRRSGEAIRRIGVTKDGVTEVEIPDVLFKTMMTSDYDIYAYVYVSDEEYGSTTHEIILKVKSRPMPDDIQNDFDEIMKAVKTLADGKVDKNQGIANNGKLLGVVDGYVVLVDAPSDTTDAVRYVEQELTEEQQEQARANIGAANVTYDTETKTLNICLGGGTTNGLIEQIEDYVIENEIEKIVIDGVEVNLSRYAKKEETDRLSANKADKTALSQEKAERQAEIAVERERINNLAKLEPGSTTGDAELIDARVDKNGNAHDNVGEHIREVTSQLSEDIVDTKTIGLSAVILTFEQGGLNPTDGTEVENEARIRSNIVKIIKGSKIKLHDSTYKFGVWQYEKDGSFITYRGLEQTDFIANEDMYIRVVMSHSNTVSNIDVTIANKLCTNLYEFNIGEMGYNMESIMAEIETVEFDNWKIGYVATNQEIGEIVPMTRTYTGAWVYQVVECEKGDKFILTASGGTSPKAWCFVDETLIKISADNTTEPTYTTEIEATEKGFLIVNSAILIEYKLEKICGGIINNENVRNDFEKALLGYKKYEKIIPPSIPEIKYAVQSVPFDKTTAMTLDEIISGYDDLVELYPNYVTKTLLGNDTSDTYPIYRYDFFPSVPSVYGDVKVISHTYTKNNYPTIIMDACIHGAERPCAKAMLNLMTLIANSKDNSILGWLKDNIHFVIVPVSNVWGYVNNSRNNSNEVDLNRNFPIYWYRGDTTTDDDRYRGESPLSEKESQYLNDIFVEYENNAVCYYNWHTHGLFTGYEVMTAFNTSALRDFDAMQNIGFDVIKSITASGWTNHNLPEDSGYIGMVQTSEQRGLVSHTATLHGIPSACPEVMYRYYDGGTSEVYNNDIDCMNVEYMLYAVANACKKFLY